jgi:hypothetical protein
MATDEGLKLAMQIVEPGKLVGRQSIAADVDPRDPQ